MESETWFILFDNAPNGEVEGEKGAAGEDEKPDPEAQKAARKAAIEKFGLETARASVAQGGSQSQDGGEFEVDLDGVDETTAKAVRAALKHAGDVQKGAQALANFGMEQARKVAALEVGAEFGLDKDEVDELSKAFETARTPDALDLSRREIIIKLREDGTFAPTKTAAAGKKPAVDNQSKDTRKFDDGRGSGGNQAAALKEKLDAIDPTTPEGMTELAKLETQVMAAQARYTERAQRRG